MEHIRMYIAKLYIAAESITKNSATSETLLHSQSIRCIIWEKLIIMKWPDMEKNRVKSYNRIFRKPVIKRSVFC